MKREIKFWVKRSIFLIIFSGLAFRVYGFSFVVLGDSRDGKGPSPILAQEMKEINLLSPDFIVHTGDWAGYPGREGWENFLKVMKIGKVPYHLVVGNHEVSRNWKDWYTLYKEMIKKPLYYSFKYGNCSFIILCCYSEKNGKTIGGKIDKEQFKWLERQLEKAKNSDFIFVFVHEPLYPVDGHICSSLDRYPEERDKLANLLRKYNAVVFCGHEHLYNKKVVNGLTQIITSGAGAPLYASPEKGGFYHYLYVTVKEKKFRIAVITPGNIFDPELKVYKEKLSFEKEEIKGLIPCYEGKRPIEIDGNLNDWIGISPLRFSSPYYLYGGKNNWNGKDDFSAEVYLSWDKDRFYIGVKVKDDIFKNNSSDDSLWNGDSLQIAFDPFGDTLPGMGYDKNDCEYGFALTKKGKQSWCWFPPGEKGLQKDIPFEIKLSSGYLFYEVSIPFEKIGIQPCEGKRFKFNLVIFDDDKGKGAEKWFALTPGITGGKDPSLFREFILVKGDYHK